MEEYRSGVTSRFSDWTDDLPELDPVDQYIVDRQLDLIAFVDSHGWFDCTRERQQELRTMPYGEYLRTPEWKRRAALAKRLASYRCQMCGRDTEAGANLHVHHPEYSDRGYELPSGLIVLCSACHGRHHGKRP